MGKNDNRSHNVATKPAPESVPDFLNEPAAEPAAEPTEAEPTAEPAAEPAAAPAEPTEAEKEAQALEEAKAKILADKQAKIDLANGAKIAEMLAKIAEADKALARYQGDDPMTVEDRQFMIDNRPEAWKMRNELPVLLRDELAEFQDSIKPEGVRTFIADLSAINKSIEDAIANRTEMFESACDTFPAYISEFKALLGIATVKAKAEKTGESKQRSTGGTGDFTGTLRSNEEDEKLLDAIIKKAIATKSSTGETDILRSLYPGEYKMGDSPVKLKKHTVYMKVAKANGTWTGAK